jgi:hypothetical protein
LATDASMSAVSWYTTRPLPGLSDAMIAPPWFGVAWNIRYSNSSDMLGPISRPNSPLQNATARSTSAAGTSK